MYKFYKSLLQNFLIDKSNKDALHRKEKRKYVTTHYMKKPFFFSKATINERETEYARHFLKNKDAYDYISIFTKKIFTQHKHKESLEVNCEI